MDDPREIARRRAMAAQLVRDQVLAQSFADMPAPTARQKLTASHYQLSSSASPLVLAGAGRNAITAADLARAAQHRPRFGQS
ncbi:hypothetical protein [Mesorhizobium sp. M8A.F.Ca.ET.218.01.1.1]|uniref:hypothetical protein n=2 Tax=unclassified Mesorhizobium TaxID=325217 RepID=UPI0010927A50|nr:hypothetical protein [Mesorhizobium sp. M8A.F.Ca.ET.218.01.1.1]TGP93822.1 hypothetical protein EN861_17175 [Mesorhizobium sp. M8A.F.Ca.ET.218.01.1.1]